MKIMDANRINEKREIYSFVGCMHRERETNDKHYYIFVSEGREKKVLCLENLN